MNHETREYHRFGVKRLVLSTTPIYSIVGTIDQHYTTTGINKIKKWYTLGTKSSKKWY